MRMYAYLREPLVTDGGDPVYKVMLYASEEGTYLFEYCSPDAVLGSADRFYLSGEELHDEWDPLTDGRGWMPIGDPLPGCQHDAFLPVRVKGRDTGMPEWGKYELLKDGEWVDFDPLHPEQS